MVVGFLLGLSLEIADGSREGLFWVWTCPRIFRLTKEGAALKVGQVRPTDKKVGT